MAITTYQITGNPSNILPHATAHGSITVFDPNTGIFTWVPNNSYSTLVPVYEFTIELLCDSLVVDSSDINITVNPVASFCNTSFTIKAVKNNCTLGVPSSIDYTVPANIVCQKPSVAEANWEAYLLSIPLAQTQANLGLCITTECVPMPCVLSYSLSKITISGTPGYKIRIYKELVMILEVTIPVSGVVVLNDDLLQGNIFVTQVSTSGIESQKNCIAFELVDPCYLNMLEPCQ